LKKQFEVWRYNFGERGEHPCVILTRTDLCGRPWVNILYCTSQRQGRQPKLTEVLLDQADGLDWETFVECSQVWLVPAADLFDKRGHITLDRRNAIRDKIRDIFRLSARD